MDAHSEATPDEAQFNVTGGLPQGQLPEDFRTRALVAGLPSDRVESIVQVLARGHNVRLAAGVNRKRADRFQRDFSRLGLVVSIQPLLTLAPVEAIKVETREACPACGEIAVMPANRQCPTCGVFVDKVSAELKRKRLQLEQDRLRAAQQAEKEAADLAAAAVASERAAQLQQAQEDQLRQSIRAELEVELMARASGQIFKGRAGAWRILAMLTLCVLCFGAGWNLSQIGYDALRLDRPDSASQAPQVAISMEAVDRVMASLASHPERTSAFTASPASGVAGRTGTLQVAEVSGPPGAAATLAPDAEAASPPFVVPGLVQSPVGADESLFNINARRQQLRAEMATGGAAAASAAESDVATTPSGLLSRLSQTQLMADFAVRLAELGQLPRAQEVIVKLKALPEVGKDPIQSTLVRLAELEVAAWSVREAAAPATAAEALRNEALRWPDPAQRAVALGRVGAIFATQRGLPDGLALSCLLRGGESLKLVADASRRSAASGDWLLAMGQALTADIRELAASGRWSKVEAVADQLEVLAAQAQGSTPRAGLRGMQVTVRAQLGQAEAAQKLAEKALSEIGALGTPLARAEALRTLARWGGSSAAARVTEALQQQIASLEGQKGEPVAFALARLALLQANAGQFEAFEALKARALVVPGLNKGATVTLEAEMTAGAELARAALLHRAGQFSEAERVLRQLAYKLF